jgi:SP family general alpha glucoside:H+ symporter-like MFS transporter
MSTEKTVTAQGAIFDPNDPDTIQLLHSAREAQLLDQQLTIRQALRKYKKGVFWAMILSTALIMEGYDVVIASCMIYAGTRLISRFPPSTAKSSSSADSAS